VDVREIRMRCIEAAARAPMTHEKGYAAAVLDTATAWADWVFSSMQVGVESLPPVFVAAAHEARKPMAQRLKDLL